MATKKKPAVKPAKAKASTPAKKAAPKAAKKAATPVKKKAVASKPIAKKTVASKAVPAKKATKATAKPAAKAKTPPKPVKKAAPAAKASNTKKTAVKATPAKKTAPAKKVASNIKKPAIALKKTETKKTTMVKKTETTNKSTAKKETVKPAAAPAKKAPAKADPKKATAATIKSATALKSAPAARPEPTPAPTPRGEKKPTVIVAHRRLENKSKKVSEEPSGKTMINYQPDFTRSILDEPEMQSGPVYRYSDEELNEFRELIQGRLEAARKELGFLQGLITRKDEAGTEDTENRYMNMEDGSGAMEREQLAQLASRQIQFINHLEKALIRIENKTYGICRVTGKLIDKARLRAVPHATLSIEAKKTMSAR